MSRAPSHGGWKHALASSLLIAVLAGVLLVTPSPVFAQEQAKHGDEPEPIERPGAFWETAFFVGVLLVGAGLVVLEQRWREH